MQWAFTQPLQCLEITLLKRRYNEVVIINLREITMKLKYIATLLISLGLLTTSNLTVASPHNHDNDSDHEQHQRHMHHKKGHKMHQRMMHKLEKAGASEQQLADIKVIHESGQELRKAKHQEIKALKTQIRELAKQETLDEQTLRDLLLSAAEKKADLMIMHINSRHQVKALLNDEQKTKLEEMHRKHSH